MKLFDHAVWKLTAIYAGILLIVTVGFSAAFFAMTDVQFNRPLPSPRAENALSESYWSGSDDVRIMVRQRDNEIRSNLLVQLIIIDLGVLLVGSVASYFLARRTLRPVNEMVERETRFVSDASHELRTPLAAMAMENEVVLRDKEAGKEELCGQVESNLEEIGKLRKLTDTLLQISQDEPITDPKERAVVIEQIIKILVENAVKYDPKHRLPKVVHSGKGIKVIDQGPGIAPEDLPHIFDRFYRAEKSRTTDGYGLGLALAQQLASQMNMKISAENNKGKGATFTIS